MLTQEDPPSVDVPKMPNGTNWMVYFMENPTQMDDLGVPP